MSKWERLNSELADARHYAADMKERVAELEKENAELRMVLDYIDKYAGPADRTCHEPGIKLSEAARRDLADMGKLDYTYEVQP